MIRARHVSDIAKDFDAITESDAARTILARGGYVISRSNAVMLWDDFPVKNPHTHPLKIPPLDITMLRDIPRR